MNIVEAIAVARKELFESGNLTQAGDKVIGSGEEGQKKAEAYNLLAEHQVVLETLKVNI